MVRGLIIILSITFLSVSVAFSQSVDIDLAGYNQVPEVRTPAIGFVEVTIEGDSLFVEGKFSDLRGSYWSAYIHYGEPGKIGNRLFRLTAELNEDRNGGVFKKEDNRFELRESHMEAIRKGFMYINVASNRNQRGEIRGQIPAL